MTKKLTKSMKRKLKLISVLIVFFVIAGSGYYSYMVSHEKTKSQMPLQAVSAMIVTEKEIMPEASFVARIESKDKVGLRARVSGFLQERLFKEGDVVKKDQPLFLIEKVNFEANVREAEANYAKAQANAKNAQSQYERTQTLFKTKDVSEARLDEARAVNESAKADVAQTKALLDLAQKDLEYTVITAPMDGKIGESKYSVGELIGPDSGVLATLVTIDPIDAVFSVSENQLLVLQDEFKQADKTEVYFITSNGKTYPEAGQINFVDVTLDENMNTLKIKASFPNPDNKLIAGQYGRVLLKSLTPVKAIVIPMKAVQQDMTGSFVYVLTADNKVERRMIKRGTELADFEMTVSDGLKVGDKIVTEGFQKIAPQMTVQPVFDK